MSYHYFTLVKKNEDTKVLKVKRMNHKIEIGLLSWILKPIFSNESEDQQQTVNLNSFKNECLMCYDEITDVMIYPCRHLSIGFKCADLLRKSSKCFECPVCRGNIERFIKINL